jgi:hypothetical protein
MSTQKVALAEATEPQLREFAQNTLGMDVKPGDTPAKLKAAITKAWNQDFIIVGAKVEAAPLPGHEARPAQVIGQAESVAGNQSAAAGAAAPLVPGGSNKDPRVKIIIPRQEGPGGDRSVEVAVNGTLILIPRGQPCDVAYRYYEALRNATQTLYDMDDDSNILSREVPAYPFSVLEMPPAEAVAAWLATQ